MADWLYIGYCTVMAMFAVAAAYAAAFGRRLWPPRTSPFAALASAGVCRCRDRRNPYRAEDEQCAAEHESAADDAGWVLSDRIYRIDRIIWDW